MLLNIVDISLSNDVLFGRTYLVTLASKSREVNITLVFGENEVDDMPDTGSTATLSLNESGLEIRFDRRIAHVNTTVVPIRKSIIPGDHNYLVVEMAEEVELPLFSMLFSTLSQMTKIKIPTVKIPFTRARIYVPKAYDFLQRSFFLDKYAFVAENTTLRIYRL